MNYKSIAQIRTASPRLQVFGRWAQIPLWACVHTHTHITPPPPQRLYKFLSHGVTVLNRALDIKSALPDASSPQTRGQNKVREVSLRVWPCRGRAKPRMPFLPPQNMQTTLSFAKTMGVGGAHWHHACCYRVSNLWDQVCFLLSLSLRWKVQK